jgi:hypothetical protein
MAKKPPTSGEESEKIYADDLFSRYHPETAGKFDEEYGTGRAKQILDTYGPAKGTMPASEPARRPAFPAAVDVTALLRDPRYSAARQEVREGHGGENSWWCGDGGELRTLISIISAPPNHIERDMIAVMEAQRRLVPKVGGFCQLTSLRQHTVTQRIFAPVERVMEARGRDEFANSPRPGASF